MTILSSNARQRKFRQIGLALLFLVVGGFLVTAFASRPPEMTREPSAGVARSRGVRPAASGTLAKPNTSSDQERTALLATIQRFLERDAPFDALSLIERRFPNWFSDAPVAELRAKAKDEIAVACPKPSCRLKAAMEANESSPTPNRADAMVDAKRALSDSLTFGAVEGETTLARIRRLREFGALGSEAVKIPGIDSGLKTLGESAMSFGQSERSKVALMGAAEDVVVELLGELTTKTSTVSFQQVGTILIFVVFDAARSCRGLYVVGASNGQREISGTAWDVEAFLSQAIGRPAKLKHPSPPTRSATRWGERGIPVVARWRDGIAEELRIGNASP